MTGPSADLGAGLPALPAGFEVKPRGEPIGARWVWAYAGATSWLPSRYPGEAQPANNLYAGPVAENKETP